jgi:hypothetical protein
VYVHNDTEWAWNETVAGCTPADLNYRNNEMTCYASLLYDGTKYRFQIQEVCLETYLNSYFFDPATMQPVSTITATTVAIEPPEVDMFLPEGNVTAKPSLVIIGYHSLVA